MSGCTHDCSSCGESCSSRTQTQDKITKELTNHHNNIKRVIGVVSGKGGVGKSLVTSLLAVEMQRRGFKTAIIDADITGPSIPKAFGIKEKATGDENFMMPPVTKTGIPVMSVNLLLEDETDPVVWRGPVVAGVVKQFWKDVVYGEVDYMFVDMPPGTGDVPLTVYQSLPIDGIIIVTSPQELVSMIVGKAIKMAKLMNIPVIGLVENFAYAICPDCGKHIEIFGKSHLEETAAKFRLPMLARLPIDPSLAHLVDEGRIEDNKVEGLKAAADLLAQLSK
ncbi:MAG: Mrp/NBP35 family ATP-binding protein [Clostridiales bacterium]|nr:Mrp/NBP35 family ATP-binding protein [Clostridiales bacterium]